MSLVLQALTRRYRRSTAGSREAARDFLLDYEMFLREAGLSDGDARELAEHDLRVAARESGGLLGLDADKRSGLIQRIRLKRSGGAAWLFGKVGEIPPDDARSQLAAFFRDASLLEIPNEPRWGDWCCELSRLSTEGGSIQPFRRDDLEGNRLLLNALTGVLRWRGESLIRFVSSRICGDSKTLENLEGRLLCALRSLRGVEVSLDQLGILRKPRTLTFHGSLILKLGNRSVDFAPLPGPSRISEINLIHADEVNTQATLCLTVENEEVFLELAKLNAGWLLIHTSFPGAAVVRLFERLPADLKCLHFGDSDPSGFDILRDLRERTGRRFRPVCMNFRQDPRAIPLTGDEQAMIERLLASPVLGDVHSVLLEILQAGCKGAFEQESIQLSEMLARIAETELDSSEPDRFD